MRAVLRHLVATALLVLVTGLAALPSQARSVVSLDDGWKFGRADLTQAREPGFDDTGWPTVTLPHTWNASDGEAGGSYYRGPAWYRRVLTLPAAPAGIRRFIEFDGAALAADVWVNGHHAGRHEGGYARFRFDVTPWLQPGDNRIAVRVDSARQPQIAPLGGDFTIFGGLYRGVRLVSTAPLHLDLLDHGGPGMHVDVRVDAQTGDRGRAPKATLQVRALLRNDGTQRQSPTLRLTLRDVEGRSVLQQQRVVAVAPGATEPAALDLALVRPRLWQGVHDPYLYRLSAEVLHLGRVVDAVDLPVGVRQFAVDPRRGLLLNGVPYPLHGVNYFHPGRPGRGVAVGGAEIDEDFRLLGQLGVTGLRLVHYQHPPRVYELADRHGYVLWTEIPLNAAMDEGAAFRDNLGRQLRELMRQTGHHASVAVWGLGNEVYRSDAPIVALLGSLHAQARADDPRRPTAYAHCCAPDDHPMSLQADLTGYNRYLGWYDGQPSDLGPWADRVQALLPQRAFGLGEYGAGASVLHQQDPPRRPLPNSAWHPEQYQSLFHEAYWQALQSRPGVWGSFVWLAFDHASAGRNEGDRAGLNDKGLVTYDRRVTKDAYHHYRAQWSASPMAYITSRRYSPRAVGPVVVKVYTNGRRATLWHNGAAVAEVATASGIAIWPAVALEPGRNLLRVRTDHGAEDTIEWIATP